MDHDESVLLTVLNVPLMLLVSIGTDAARATAIKPVKTAYRRPLGRLHSSRTVEFWKSSRSLLAPLNNFERARTQALGNANQLVKNNSGPQRFHCWLGKSL